VISQYREPEMTGQGKTELAHVDFGKESFSGVWF